MNNLQPMEHHFERVASVYDRVRNTDPDVIETIITYLPGDNRPIYVADIGCGTGRYSKIIAARLDNNLRLFCCDYSDAMLAECCERMSKEFPSKNIHYCRASASDLPFADGCFDAIATFNAVHHFDLDRFVAVAARVLRRGGLLSIYTRTPEQNARTVWGQHFPGFIERETRLYQYARLEEAISSVSELRLEGIQEFRRVRVESLESLLERARHFHYSTFALYPANEFNQALEGFAERLNALSNEGTIEHTAENTLVLARRI
jgi:ubiquinone/menaquinone biosynthesis C-methylase UbiE